MAKTADDRRREAVGQSSKVSITSGGPGSMIATYKGTTMRSKEHAQRVAVALRARGWTAAVEKDNTVVATARFSG